MDTNEIKHLAEIMKGNDIINLEIEDGKMKIKLERGAAQGAVLYSAAGPAAAIPEQAAAGGEKAEDPYDYITAPMVGVFYASSAPGEPVFVKEGSVVKKTDTVCIIEAMKLMNDIAAGMDGEITKILAKNGDIVEYGQKLFAVKKA